MGQALLIALGVAIEPLPLIGYTVVLDSKGGRRNTWGFIAGWVACIAVVAGATAITAGAVPASAGPNPSALTTGIVQLVFGVTFLLLAARRSHRPEKPDTGPPKWMQRLDELTPKGAALVGVLLQPWPLVSASVLAVLHSTGAVPAQVAGVAVAALVMTSTYLAIQVLSGRDPEATSARLARGRAWVERHREKAITWLLLGLGAWLVASGAIAIALAV